VNSNKDEPISLKDIKKRLREMMEWCEDLKSGRLCLISRIRRGIMEYMMRAEEREQL
jgi:hypothetical protein